LWQTEIDGEEGVRKVCPFFPCFFRFFRGASHADGAPVKRVFISFWGLLLSTLFRPFLFFRSLPLPSSFLSLRPYILPVSELLLTLIFTQLLSAVARGLTGGEESRTHPSPRRSISTCRCPLQYIHGPCAKREHSRSASYHHAHTHSISHAAFYDRKRDEE
jgi:hypothetical protein